MNLKSKRPKLTEPCLAMAMESLSKAALIDIVTSLAQQQYGDPQATEDNLASVMQPWIDIVTTIRQDAKVDLAAKMYDIRNPKSPQLARSLKNQFGDLSLKR